MKKKKVDLTLVRKYHEFGKRVRAGEVTAAELHATVDELLADEEKVKAELRTLTLAELVGGSRHRYKKEGAVGYRYTNLFSQMNIRGSYLISFTKPLRDILVELLKTITDEEIKEYKEERDAKTAEIKKALENPLTIEDFNKIETYGGPGALEKLSTEKKALRDNLIAEIQFDRQKEEKVRRVEMVDTEELGLEFEIKKHWHSKRGCDVFIVTMSTRVDREDYKTLLARAKTLDGWYSKSWKGSPAGFTFLEKETAERFIEADDLSDDIEARVKYKREKAAKRLRETATRREENAEEVLNAGRKTNTARRAEMAASVEASARGEIAFAGTLKNISEALKAGSVKFLSGVKAATHAELFERLLNNARHKKSQDGKSSEEAREIRTSEITVDAVDFVAYPKPYIHINDILRIHDHFIDKKGYKMAAAKVYKYIKGDNICTVPEWAIKDMVKLMKAGGDRMSWIFLSFKKSLDDFNRLERMGLKSIQQLRAALREYLPFRSDEEKEDPIKAMERALIGEPFRGRDFFPTPLDLAERMVRRAGIQPGQRILEPQAGIGHIAQVIREAGHDVDCCEVEGAFRDILELKGFKLVGEDFLQMEQNGGYDIILMNPPFSECRDIDHVRHAWKHLLPGGRIVAIMGAHYSFASDTKSRDFREWLSTVNSRETDLGEAFAGTDAFRQTRTRSRLVKIDKGAA